MTQKKQFAIINLFAGKRLDIPAEDRIQAASMMVDLMIDRNKEWDAVESPVHKDVYLIKGYDKDDGTFITLIVTDKEYADKNDLFSIFKNVSKGEK